MKITYKFFFFALCTILLLLSSFYAKSEPSDKEPFFIKKMVDTNSEIYKKLNLNPFCIRDVLKSDERKINYAECLAQYQDTKYKERSLVNFDGETSNVSTQIIFDGEDWFIDFADFYGEFDSHNGLYYYEIVVNYGGTGNFSSIHVFGLRDNELEHLSTIPAGDRCNDGRAEYISTDTQHITYSTAATPFRLLNYKDDTDWRHVYLLNAFSRQGEEKKSLKELAQSANLYLPELFNGLEPYKDLDNCAICCVGNVIKSFNTNSNITLPVGITIDKHYITNKPNHNNYSGCIYVWLTHENFKQYKSYRENNKFIYLDYLDWEQARKKFTQACS